jgi:hypothetical protein
MNYISKTSIIPSHFLSFGAIIRLHPRMLNELADFMSRFDIMEGKVHGSISLSSCNTRQEVDDGCDTILLEIIFIERTKLDFRYTICTLYPFTIRLSGGRGVHYLHRYTICTLYPHPTHFSGIDHSKNLFNCACVHNILSLCTQPVLIYLFKF